MEIWRDIKGYEGLYQVSNYGKVKSFDRIIPQKNNSFAIKKGRMLSASYDGSYLFVGLVDKNGIRTKYKIHRLVAFAFPEICGGYFDGAEVNHKNEIKTDNNAENLEWCTRSYNTNYGTRNERVSNKNKNGKCSKEIIQYSNNGEFIKLWQSSNEIERVLNYSHSYIIQVCKGNYETAYGYKWRYKN